MADNKEAKNDPYDELKGYFPETLDLSPEELEKEIATENKQRDIALNMTAPKAAPDEAELLDDIPTVQPNTSEKDVVAAADDDIILEEGAYSDEPAASEDEEWIPPVAMEVTDNELLNKYASLDELLDELEVTEEDNEKKVSKFAERVNWVFDFLEVFTVCMACIILMFSFFARLTKVDGPSMEDTLQDGQYLIISDFAYTPKAGDIVVLQNTSLSIDLLKNPLVKRIIAVGGQIVDVSADGKVTVTDADGTTRELDQSFTKNEEYRKSPCRIEIPEGYVFVMGDNRNNSTDSRDPRLGLVDERCIFGRALFRVLPFGDFTVFENPYND